MAAPCSAVPASPSGLRRTGRRSMVDRTDCPDYKPPLPEGAAVYSQDNLSCPPCFACLSGAARRAKPERLSMARPCVTPAARHLRDGPESDDKQPRKPMKTVKFPTRSVVVVVFVGAGGNGVGAR